MAPSLAESSKVTNESLFFRKLVFIIDLLASLKLLEVSLTGTHQNLINLLHLISQKFQKTANMSYYICRQNCMVFVCSIIL